jgi:hypothetical protein
MRPVFRYPFSGSYPVSSGFGPRGGGMHTGTDFSIPSGVPILASNDGTVIYCAYEAGGAGNTVTISGEDGWQSRYHHMERWTVSVGQHVNAGDQVGICDSTGASSGPHLHFEIRSNPSTPVDPIPILEADAGSSPTPAPEPIPQEEDIMYIAVGDALMGRVACTVDGGYRVGDFFTAPALFAGIPQDAIDWNEEEGRGLRYVYFDGDVDRFALLIQHRPPGT